MRRGAERRRARHARTMQRPSCSSTTATSNPSLCTDAAVLEPYYPGTEQVLPRLDTIEPPTIVRWVDRLQVDAKHVHA